jgi:phosphohistidine phosphatase
MAEHLRRKGIAPELVLCSPATRTRETLARIEPGLGEKADVRIDSELYAASAAALLEVLHEVPDEIESVMLIGHNPGIQDLALSLAGGGPEILRLRSKVSDRDAGNAGAQRNLAGAGARKGRAGVLREAEEVSRGAAAGA